MQRSADISEHVQKQIVHYKGNGSSICKTCTKYYSDCFQTMKTCGKDKNTNYSFVEKCGSYKQKTSAMGAGSK